MSKIPFKTFLIQLPKPTTSPFTKAHHSNFQALSKPKPNPELIRSTNLVKLHCDRGDLADARRVFDEMPNRDVVAWTAMISGYASNNRPTDAWTVFREMVGSGIEPNAYTVSSALKALKGVEWGPLGSAAAAAVHGTAMRRGVERVDYVENALLDAYAACENGFADARKVFDEMAERSVVAWTAMIAGYTRWGEGSAALRVFQRMVQEGAELNPFTSSIAIRACGSVANLTLGMQIHAITVKSGHETNLPVANSLVDMYSRCMSLSEAKQYFNQMPERDSITWNTMIAALDRSNSHEAFHLLLEMRTQSVQPSCFTFTSIVSACANFAVLNCGQQVHATILRRGFAQNQQIGNALINMYTKCGSVTDSKQIFDEMTHRDLVSWTSMMIGYGINGFGNEAIELFEGMIGAGIRPDPIVYMGLLSACSHAGLVDAGLRYFHSMSTEYGVQPEKEVYGCIVDLLGRAGRVEEAYELVERMPFEPDESIWGALLGACKMHGNVEIGKLAGQRILDLKPEGAKTYVMLSNIYAAGREWGEVGEVRRMLKGMGNRKEAGKSWVDVRGEVLSFVANDRSSNACVCLAYEVLSIMVSHMEEAGHVFELEGVRWQNTG